MAQAIDQGNVTVTAYVAPENEVIFSGRTVPFGQVYLLRNGQLIENSPSNSGGNFQISNSDISAGEYIFGLYSIDSEGTQSSTTSFTVTVSQGTITLVSGIILSPTIKSNKSQAVAGESIIFSGQAVPNSSVSLDIDNGTVVVLIEVGADGIYYHNYSTLGLIIGTHEVKSFTSFFGADSSYSRTVEFEVTSQTTKEDEGDEDDEEEDQQDICSKTDLNNDSKTNIVDFSILLFWYNRENTPGRIDLSDDGEINLTDFSIQVYCWTG